VVQIFAPWLVSAAAASRHGRVTEVTNWILSNLTYTPHESPGRGIAEGDIVAVIMSRIDTQMKAEAIRHSVGAVRQLHDRRLRLIIVGDGDAFDGISRAARTVNRELGRRRAVAIAGSMHDPGPAFAVSDIMIGMDRSAVRSPARSKPLIIVGEQGFSRISSLGRCTTSSCLGSTTANGKVGRKRTWRAGFAGYWIQRVDANSGGSGTTKVLSRFGLDVSAEMLECIYRTEIDGLLYVERRAVPSAVKFTRAVGHERMQTLRDRIGSLTSARG